MPPCPNLHQALSVNPIYITIMQHLLHRFKTLVAQTSKHPLAIEISRAEGMYLYGPDGNRYLDLVAGINVNHLGHSPPPVVSAVKNQAERYMHVMVYGEYIQHPQVALAAELSGLLPPSLNCTYFVNSGTEAIEGALKLAKRYTGRNEIIAFRNAYHGSTHGSLSLMSSGNQKRPFQPLLPGIRHINFNSIEALEAITQQTACVVAEPVRGSAGVIAADKVFLKKLKQRCDQTKTLLLFDEIQTGFGRTGSMFSFEQYEVVPHILALGKAMGAGMPLAAFVASHEMMDSLTHNPMLGHITTFGGNAVCCAAGLAGLKMLTESKLIAQVKDKEALFVKKLTHPAIKAVRSQGLLIAIEFDSLEFNLKVINKCIENRVITFPFLLAENCMRISPPLIITEQEIEQAVDVILRSIEQVS